MRERDKRHVELKRAVIIAAIGGVNFETLKPQFLSTGLDKENNVMLNFTAFTGHKIRVTALNRKERFSLIIGKDVFEGLTDLELRSKIAEIIGFTFF